MLKFRIWNNYTKKWIKGYKEAKKFFHGFCNDKDERNIGLSFWKEPDGYFRIFKSTGLKDKNKIEIFEGDIVKWSDSPNEDRIAEVEIFNGEVHFYRINKYTNRKLGINDFNIGNFIYSDTSKYLEIIGNIMDNPEFKNGKRD